MTMENAFTRLGTFRTERLCIRPIRPSDAEAVFSFKSDDQVTECYGQEPHRTIDETNVWLENRMKDYAKRESVFWVITLKNDDIAIGECCLWNFDPSFQCAEVGYELRSGYWNRGLMTEALTEVLAYGFQEMGLHRIEACPLATNSHSQDLLLKLGFKNEGRLRERHPFRGCYLDQMYLGLLAGDWKDHMTNELK
jgi:ribosomal-protein-alanine N-acetyltransferase